MPSLHNENQTCSVSSSQVVVNIAQVQADAYKMMWARLTPLIVVFILIMWDVGYQSFVEICWTLVVVVLMSIVVAKIYREKLSVAMKAERDALRSAQEHADVPWIIRFINFL